MLECEKFNLKNIVLPFLGIKINGVLELLLKYYGREVFIVIFLRYIFKYLNGFCERKLLLTADISTNILK